MLKGCNKASTPSTFHLLPTIPCFHLAASCSMSASLLFHHTISDLGHLRLISLSNDLPVSTILPSAIAW